MGWGPPDARHCLLSSGTMAGQVASKVMTVLSLRTSGDRLVFEGEGQDFSQREGLQGPPASSGIFIKGNAPFLPPKEAFLVLALTPFL